MRLMLNKQVYVRTLSRPSQFVGLFKLFFGLFFASYLTMGSCFVAKASSLMRQPNNLGLVGYWSFEDGKGGALTDFSGQGNTGILNGGYAWVSGKFGRALNFNGSSDYVSLSNSAVLNPANELTLSAWVYVNGGAGTYRDFISRWDSTGGVNERTYLIGVNSSNALYAAISSDGTDGGATIVTDPSAFPTSSWVQVSLTWNGGTMRLYRDGVEVASGSHSGMASSPNTVTGLGATIGRSGDPQVSLFNGLIDDVRIYRRALSAGEISALYTKSGYAITKNASRGLVAYWSFEDGAGVTTVDKTGNGHLGSLTNGPSWTNGKFGSGLSFDGLDDYISVSDSSLLNLTHSFTVAGWIKLAATGRDHVIFDSGTQSTRWIIQIESTNNKIDFVERDIADNLSSTGLVAEQWYHIVVIKNGDGASNLSFYLNGQSDGVASVGSVTTPSGEKRIGIWTESASNPFYGLMDDFRVYNRALSGQEVLNLYNSSGEALGILNTAHRNTLTNGLVGYWSFDGPMVSGTIARDSSPYNNNGTLTNGPTRTIGRLGQALDFDGNDDWVDVPDGTAVALNTSEGSVCTWVYPVAYPASVSASGRGNIFEAWQGASDVGFLGFDGSGGLFFGQYAGDTAAGGTVSLNEWAHVCGLWDSTDFYIYKNGIQVANGGDGVMPASTDEYRIGLPKNFASGLTGKLDDFRVYNRVLSASDILKLYNNGKQ